MTRAIPDAVLQRVIASVGQVASRRLLGGMSGRTVALLEGPAGAVVVKGPASEMELAVGRELAGP